MTALKSMLDDAADDARIYDVTDRAVRVVTRRRTMTRLVPVAAALLVIAGLIGVSRPFSGGGGQEPSASAEGLPPHLTAERSPPALPEDRGVGPATLAYLPGGDQQRWVLVTADGRQYRVEELLVDGISPDGRWLLTLRADGSRVLRDLNGTARQEFTGGDTTASVWSPDSRRLVVQVSGGSPGTYLVDLTTAARSMVPLDPASTDRVCAVRNSGELLLCPQPEPSSGLRLADSTTGRVIRDIPTTALGLRPTEAKAEPLETPALDLDDRTLFIRTHDTAGQHNFMVGFDLDTGRLTQRYQLPDESPPAERPYNGGVEYGQPDAHYLLGFHADGLLLLHVPPSRSDPFEAGAVEIELIARDTGTLRTVTLASRPIGLIRYRG